MATSDYTDRVLDLAHQVGDAVKDHLPSRAMQWMETGAAVGALRTGTRVATKVIRRNPVLAVAAVAGAGVLWYAAKKRAERAESGEALEGEAKRVTTRRAGSRKSSSSRSTARTRRLASESAE